MSQLQIVLCVILGFYGLLFVAGVVLYNRLVRARTLVREAESAASLLVQRRRALLQDMQRTLDAMNSEDASQARDLACFREMIAQEPDLDKDAQTELTTRFSGLTEERTGKRTENLTDALTEGGKGQGLNLNGHLTQVRGLLCALEEDLSSARRYYNGTVRELNARIESVPSCLVARLFRFRKKPFWHEE